MIIPAHIQSICDEFGIRIVDKHRYPEPGETRAVATIDRIWRRYGEGHIRLVLSTQVETANNSSTRSVCGWRATWCANADR
jgi:hypothetical protein